MKRIWRGGLGFMGCAGVAGLVLAAVPFAASARAQSQSRATELTADAAVTEGTRSLLLRVPRQRFEEPRAPETGSCLLDRFAW